MDETFFSKSTPSVFFLKFYSEIITPNALKLPKPLNSIKRNTNVFKFTLLEYFISISPENVGKPLVFKGYGNETSKLKFPKQKLLCENFLVVRSGSNLLKNLLHYHS